LGDLAARGERWSEAQSYYQKAYELANAVGAKNMVDAMNPEQLDASHYYLRAICGARMNNQDVLTTNLARAVSLNGEIRKMAKDDVEFIKFFNNPLFEGAIR
ncbi:MAG: hypothetical protein NTU43_05995, partial [Bacteroidetes bacterium]|nr:hypothetical protein [Bacteroidota bacterium]